jgi:hypothetical protein
MLCRNRQSQIAVELDVRFINTLPATVGAQHAAPLLPEGYAQAQDLRNGHLGRGGHNGPNVGANSKPGERPQRGA